MAGVVVALLLTCALAAQAASWEGTTGPHATTVVTGAGPDGRDCTHRPSTLGPDARPFVVLVVGAGSNPKNCDAVPARLASQGVGAIADRAPQRAPGATASSAHYSMPSIPISQKWAGRCWRYDGRGVPFYFVRDDRYDCNVRHSLRQSCRRGSAAASAGDAAVEVGNDVPALVRASDHAGASRLADFRGGVPRWREATDE